MVPEAQMTRTEHGLVATGDGWFVLNAGEAAWRELPQRGACCDFEGETDFPQLGINLRVLGRGEPIAMYHWEADQENFLVLSGEAVLIIEGEERPLRAWDFVHCPAGTRHTIVGAGDEPCLIVAVGARVDSTGPDWGGYEVDEAAARHGVSVEQATNDAEVAYARFPRSHPTPCREEWLPQWR
jgi:uncharacterized cupin superfamily protein